MTTRKSTSSSDPKLGLVADARTPIEELEKHLGLKLVPDDEETDVDTIGGLVFSMLGRVPARGELIRHPRASSSKFSMPIRAA